MIQTGNRLYPIPSVFQRVSFSPCLLRHEWNLWLGFPEGNFHGFWFRISGSSCLNLFSTGMANTDFRDFSFLTTMQNSEYLKYWILSIKSASSEKEHKILILFFYRLSDPTLPEGWLFSLLQAAEKFMSLHEWKWRQRMIWGVRSIENMKYLDFIGINGSETSLCFWTWETNSLYVVCGLFWVLGNSLS